MEPIRQRGRMRTQIVLRKQRFLGEFGVFNSDDHVGGY